MLEILDIIKHLIVSHFLYRELW